MDMTEGEGQMRAVMNARAKGMVKRQSDMTPTTSVMVASNSNLLMVLSRQ